MQPRFEHQNQSTDPLLYERDALCTRAGSYGSDLLVTQMSDFLKDYNVTHYFTLTYGRRVSLGRRLHHFKEWADSLEWLQHRPLGWVRADETKRYSGLGFPEIPEHHHGFLVGADHLDCRHAENIWRSIAGDAKVEKYDRERAAILYAFKLAFHPIGDWDLGGLKAFRRSLAV